MSGSSAKAVECFCMVSPRVKQNRIGARWNLEPRTDSHYPPIRKPFSASYLRMHLIIEETQVPVDQRIL